MGCSQSIPIVETKLPNARKTEAISGRIISVQQTRAGNNSEDGSSRLTRGNSSDSLPSTQLVSSPSRSGRTVPAENDAYVQLLDIDAAVDDLNKRTAVSADPADTETEDPFADDNSAVFDIDEDFLFDDNLSIGSAGVQEALRGLTLEAKLSIVELVRSNSINNFV